MSASAPSASWVTNTDWIDLCAVDDITPDTGVAVLIGDVQIAIVRVGEGADERFFAIGNYDAGTSTCQGAAGAVFFSNAGGYAPKNVTVVRAQLLF